MGLKTAVGFSVLIHAGLLMFHPPEGAVPQRKALNNIQITYMHPPAQESRPLRSEPAVLPRPAILRQAQAERSSGGSESSDQRVHAEPVLPGPAPAQPKPTQRPPMDTIRPNSSNEKPKKSPELKFDLAPPPPSSNGASNFSESQFDLVRYKQMIRQHLKSRLIYPPEPIEGTVHVRIVVDPAGLLRQVMVLQASDPRLAELAVEGIRLAAPYPRFPSGLNDPQADYEFLVQSCLD